jgi:hypothetical protein
LECGDRGLALNGTMFVLRALCRWFPALRFLFVGVGYVMLLIGGVIWFICFPLTAYTLYFARVFPFRYFGVPFYANTEMFLPSDMEPLLAPICLGFTLSGLLTIYFNVRNLRRLRRGEETKSRFAATDDLIR